MDCLTYINCVDLYIHLFPKDEYISAQFRAMGFEATLDELSNAGWKARCKYNKYIEKYYVTFIHPVLHLTFKIKVTSLQQISGLHYVDIRPLKFAKHELVIRDLTEKEIPALLDIIVKLQEKTRMKQIQKIELPEAELFDLADFK